MIICYFNAIRIAIAPFETNSPLVVNAYAVLTFPMAFQGLQLISGWNSQINEFHCSIKNYQLPVGNTLNILLQFTRKFPAEYFFCLFISESFYHGIYNNASC